MCGRESELCPALLPSGAGGLAGWGAVEPGGVPVPLLLQSINLGWEAML